MANNEAPFNIIVAPFDVYIAPTGTAFPDVNEEPADPWAKLGSNGNLEYSDDGVHVFFDETVDYHRFLGSTGPRKATRSEESLRIEFELNDLSVEGFAAALGQTATTAAGPPAVKTMPLYRGFAVTEYAVLVRGPSPYMANGAAQYQIPVAVVSSSAEVVYNKTDPAGLAIQIQALEDPDAATSGDRFGTLVAQTA